MQIFVWRHSKLLSSWSMFNEPHVYGDSYLEAVIAVLAENKEEALNKIEEKSGWHRAELARLEPQVIPLEKPAVIVEYVNHG